MLAEPCLLSRARGYARLEGGGHDDQPACRGSQNNSDKQGEGGEAETSCAGLHARPKDWAFQNQCALDSMLFTARGISAHNTHYLGGGVGKASRENIEVIYGSKIVQGEVEMREPHQPLDNISIRRLHIIVPDAAQLERIPRNLLATEPKALYTCILNLCLPTLTGTPSTRP